MKRRTYHVVVLLTSPLPLLGTYFLGRPLAGWLASLDDETAALMTLLGYVLGLLVAVLAWAVVLLPLRARAGYLPISEDLAQVRREGFRTALAREQAALKEREHARDPRTRAGYHALMTQIGTPLSLVAIGLSWAMWHDGRILVLVLAAAIVCPILALYHFAQWFRLRSTSSP
jgi:hypothetical protein